MQGLYRSAEESSFVSEEQLREEVQQAEVQRFLSTPTEDPVFETPLNASKGFEYWSRRFIITQEKELEVQEFVKEARITLPHKKCAIALTSDWHVGGKNVAYRLLESEAHIISSCPYYYVATVGDLADNFMFNPAQAEDQLEQIQAQAQYVQNYFRMMADKKKLLAAVVGNHDDKWAKKTGLSLYHNFTQDYGAYLMRGMSRIILQVGDVEYKIAVAHKLQGSSIRDPNWAQKRALDAGAWGADIVCSGHTHQKGYQWKTYREYGDPLGQDFLALQLSTYKYSDGYTEDNGMGDKVEKEIGGLAVVLDPDRYDIMPFKSVRGAGEFLVDYHTHHGN
jgi:predicted phosphodiesterase